MALSGTFFPVAQAARSEGRRAGFVPAVPEDGQLQVDDVRSGAARSGSSGAALDLGGRGQARGLGRGLERAGFRVLATAIPRAFSGLRQRGFRAGGPRPDFSLAREARTLPVLPDHEGGVHGALSAHLLADLGQVPALYLEKGWGRSERGASCESRNDLVGIVSAAEADVLAQRPAGVLIFGDEDPVGNQAAEIFSVNMRKGGGSATLVPLLDNCGDPAGAARAFAERVGWA